MTYRLAPFLLVLTMGISDTPPAQASPILFTDRTVFHAATGSSTVLTLDAPTQIQYDPLVNLADYRATYQGLLRFRFDALGGVGINGDGTVTLGRTGLMAGGWLLDSATAFGFDILPNNYSFVDLSVQGRDGTRASWTIPTSGLRFLGVTSSTPFFANISYLGRSITFAPGETGISLGYTIDNVVIKTVPEPSSLLLLAAGLLGLFLWHHRRGLPSSLWESKPSTS